MCWAGAVRECPAPTKKLTSAARFRCGLPGELKRWARTHSDSQIGSTTVSVLSTPCHTSGHVLYLAKHTQRGAGALFTGDTLFVGACSCADHSHARITLISCSPTRPGGCGRFFEGTPKQMFEVSWPPYRSPDAIRGMHLLSQALCTRISALPDDTEIYCGHEYGAPHAFCRLSFSDASRCCCGCCCFGQVHTVQLRVRADGRARQRAPAAALRLGAGAEAAG